MQIRAGLRNLTFHAVDRDLCARDVLGEGFR
jgi:hypothetical protein